MKAATLLLAAAGFALSAAAQRPAPFGAAFYDVDRLYDTVPSRFYDDGDYTPQGRLRWDTRRYRRKVAEVARVIDSMGLPVVALYGVENEGVVRDITAACRNDYAYVHRTSDSYDGLDFALLYFGDRFFPERVTLRRGAMCVEGSAGTQSLAVVITHRCASIGVLAEELGLLRGDRNIILLGTPNKLNFSEYGLADATAAAERAGRGNVNRNGRWQMRDRIATNITCTTHCDVYADTGTLARDGRPAPTFERSIYRGGAGRYLPVFIYFDETFAR